MNERRRRRNAAKGSNWNSLCHFLQISSFAIPPSSFVDRMRSFFRQKSASFWVAVGQCSLFNGSLRTFQLMRLKQSKLSRSKKQFHSARRRRNEMYYLLSCKAFRINFVWKGILHSSCYIQFILLSSSSLNNFIMNIYIFFSSLELLLATYKMLSWNFLQIYIYKHFFCSPSLISSVPVFFLFSLILLINFFCCCCSSRMCVLLNCFVYTIQYQITHLNDYYLAISEARYGSKPFFHHHITNLYKYT